METTKEYPGIDYDFRPVSYFEDEDVLSAILRGVKGAKRRRIIKDHWNAGRVHELGDELLAANPSPKVRRTWERVHPSFMGGEYLPTMDADETEIASISLRSTTSDVISIRARRADGKLVYSIEDEYHGDFTLACETGTRPFSLREFIEFLDGSSLQDYASGPLPLQYNIDNSEYQPREELRYFTSIGSYPYPQLSDHYEHVFEDWVNEKEDGEEDDDDEEYEYEDDEEDDDGEEEQGGETKKAAVD